MPEKTGTPTAAVGVPVQTFIQKVYQRIGAKAENNNVKEAVPKISGLLADGDFIWTVWPISGDFIFGWAAVRDGLPESPGGSPIVESLVFANGCRRWRD